METLDLIRATTLVFPFFLIKFTFQLRTDHTGRGFNSLEGPHFTLHLSPSCFWEFVHQKLFRDGWATQQPVENTNESDLLHFPVGMHLPSFTGTKQNTLRSPLITVTFPSNADVVLESPCICSQTMPFHSSMPVLRAPGLTVQASCLVLNRHRVESFSNSKAIDHTATI